MAQLEVVRFRDLLEVTQIPRFVPGVFPPMVEIHGPDFSSADVILINEMPCPEFIIVSKGVVYAQLPSEAKAIATIQVLSSGFTKNTTGSKMEFVVGDKTHAISGIIKLVQLFTKWIMQSPGSDLFNPTRGGGLQQIVGQVATGRDMQPVFSALTQAISTTVSQIRQAQIKVPELPLDERLLSAELLGLNVFEAQMQVLAKVAIRSSAGDAATSSLVL